MPVGFRARRAAARRLGIPDRVPRSVTTMAAAYEAVVFADGTALTSAEVAERCQLSAARTRVVLRHLARVGLVAKKNHHWRPLRPTPDWFARIEHAARAFHATDPAVR